MDEKPTEEDFRKLAALLAITLLRVYDWCGHDYPDWPAVEVALRKAIELDLNCHDT